MKQSAIVIASLFAVAQADKNLDAAKARLHADIHGYLKNGLKFDQKVIRAVYQNAERQSEIENNFKEEARENWADGHVVMDEYVEAIKYEKSQTVKTPPTKANGYWGNIHYNNPQKIMDKWVQAVEADHELGEEWREDFHEYAENMHKSHEIMGDQIDEAWDTNGEKAEAYRNAAFKEYQAIHNPQSLAVNSAEVGKDLDNYLEAVGSAGQAVRRTMRQQERADQVPDRRMEAATHRFIQEKAKIQEGYNKAFAYEMENFHVRAGKPGGEGKLWWSHKQEIVDKWAKPMRANKIATEKWEMAMERNMRQKQAIARASRAEAKKVWPAKFEAVQKAWTELADNFDAPAPKSLASKAEIKSSLTKAWKAGFELDKAVVDDFATFSNDTVDQRKEFASEVKTYVKQKKAINQAYANAYNYEMKQFHFTQTKSGKWAVTVDNEDVIIDKWTDAQTADIEAREELKEDWIRYQRSIAAQKAAFKATAKAQWPKKFEAYQKACIDFDETVGYLPKPAPKSLITDAQQHEAEVVRGQIYDNINDRYQFNFDVKKSLKEYMNNTANARAQLKKESEDWKVASKRVQDMYAAAWNYQVAETKYTPATDSAPAHIELENAKEVSDNYRAAAQADQDLWEDIGSDLANYKKQIAPAKATLKKQINDTWIPQAEKINHSDAQIIEEVAGQTKTHVKHHMTEVKIGTPGSPASGIRSANFTHPYATLMSVEPSSMTLNQQLAAGSVFLMAMIAVAALSNKGKAESKSVEFDVEDLEMTNKKESKKQIKKTLKDIMKSNNTKVSIMNN